MMSKPFSLHNENILSAADFSLYLEFSLLEFYCASSGKLPEVAQIAKILQNSLICSIYIYWSSKFEDRKIHGYRFLSTCFQIDSFFRRVSSAAFIHSDFAIFSSQISHAVEFFTQTFPKIIFHVIAKYINSRVMNGSFSMRKTTSFDMCDSTSIYIHFLASNHHEFSRARRIWYCFLVLLCTKSWCLTRLCPREFFHSHSLDVVRIVYQSTCSASWAMLSEISRISAFRKILQRINTPPFVSDIGFF